jgi:predicted XRE-type DNA-binding protein
MTAKTPTMKTTTYPSVWDATSDTPQETASMKARSKLMMALSDIISQRQLRQKDAVELFGVTQPRISDLLRGKIHLFSLDMLMDMASTEGMSPEVSVTKLRAKPVAARSKRPVSAAWVA